MRWPDQFDVGRHQQESRLSRGCQVLVVGGDAQTGGKGDQDKARFLWHGGLSRRIKGFYQPRWGGGCVCSLLAEPLLGIYQLTAAN